MKEPMVVVRPATPEELGPRAMIRSVEWVVCFGVCNVVAGFALGMLVGWVLGSFAND
jgi:hypothetical protein